MQAKYLGKKGFCSSCWPLSAGFRAWRAVPPDPRRRETQAGARAHPTSTAAWFGTRRRGSPLGAAGAGPPRCGPAPATHRRHAALNQPSAPHIHITNSRRPSPKELAESGLRRHAQEMALRGGGERARRHTATVQHNTRRASSSAAARHAPLCSACRRRGAPRRCTPPT